MSSHEGVPHSHLVELYIEVVSGLSVEAWNISTSIRVAGDSELNDLGKRTLNLREDGSVISSPVSSEFLGAQEETSSEDEGSEGVVVSGEKTSP